MDRPEAAQASQLPPPASVAVVVVACPDGPFLVRGDVQLVTASGARVPRRRQTVALCRCGASGIKPFCDGSHKVIGFQTGVEELPARAAGAPAEPDVEE